MKNKIFPKGIPQAHELIINIIKDKYPDKIDKSQITVLDAAAGNGYITNWLNDNSFKVTPLDIDTAQWAVKGVECIEHNLNNDFPLEDNKFDLVVSVETIEHLENPYHFIRECSRVAKPDGLMIISTPNIHSFRSRFKYFFMSLPSLFEYISDDLMGQHIMPVSIGTYLYGFNSLGVELEDVYTVGLEKGFLAKTIEPFINSFTTWYSKRICKKNNYPKDHFLNRLNGQQLKQLFDDMILIITAKNSKA